MSFEIPMNGMDRLVVRLVYAQRAPLLGRAARWLLRWRGTDIDPEAAIGTGLRLCHGGNGIVVHPSTRIGTGSRSSTTSSSAGPASGNHPPEGLPGGVRTGDGAVVLFNDRDLTVGAGTIIGANAVLTTSTGPSEIWTGSPARKVSDRSQPAPRPAAG